MQGQYTELIVIQENTSDGSETFLWSSESPDFLGTYGWKEFKLSFFQKIAAHICAQQSLHYCNQTHGLGVA